MQKCEDEGCQLKGNFKEYIILNYDNIVEILKRHEKSVDRIIFARKVNDKKLSVLLCELTWEAKLKMMYCKRQNVPVSL